MADLLAEVEMLRQYNRALEAENETRNRERQVMEEEIKRLSQVGHKTQIIQSSSMQNNENSTRITTLQKQITQDKVTIALLKEDRVRLQSQLKQLQNKQSLPVNIKASTDYQLLQQKYKKLETQYQVYKETYKNKPQIEEKYRLLEEEKNRLILQKNNIQHKISNYESEIIILKNKICEKDLEVSKYKNDCSRLDSERRTLEVNKTNLYDAKKHNSEIQDFKREVQQRDAIIRSMEIKDQQKDAEVRRLDNIISTYMGKINNLEKQLEKLVNSQSRSFIDPNDVKNQEVEASNTSLRADYEAVVKENYTLNEKIRGMERRIDILESTNQNLQEEFRLSIESRKTSSRLSASQQGDDELKLILKEIRDQLHEQRQQNSQIRLQNQYLQAKVLEFENLMKNNLGEGKKSSQLESKYIKLAEDPEEENEFGLFSFKQMTDMLSSTSPKPKPTYRYLDKKNTKKSLQKQKYDVLQKKINMLKSENAGLKKHLFKKK